MLLLMDSKLPPPQSCNHTAPQTPAVCWFQHDNMQNSVREDLTLLLHVPTTLHSLCLERKERKRSYSLEKIQCNNAEELLPFVDVESHSWTTKMWWTGGLTWIHHMWAKNTMLRQQQCFFFSNQTKSNKLFKTYFRRGSIAKSGTTLLLRINAGVMTPVNPIWLFSYTSLIFSGIVAVVRSEKPILSLIYKKLTVIYIMFFHGH